ncbi:DedA family protein [Longimicrobium sp.]|uniref:DedA family protein n=1 Tax=Longimicrobium sp. TaxID=2029185 RepID=UPI003B3BE01E
MYERLRSGGGGDTDANGGGMQDWVVDVVRQMGPLGVALLMFLENVFPPLPSEVIMPLAGYLSASGQAPFWVMVAAGSVGSLAGAGFWYWVGRAVTHDRLCAWVAAHGIWLAMEPGDVERATDWFARHGRWSVFFGRLVPVVRTLISVPAGLTRMPAAPFFALSALGTTLWTFVLAYAGRLLGSQFQQVEQWIGPVSSGIVVLAVVAYFYRVARILHGRRRAGGAG